MGIYREKVLPRIVDKACGMKNRGTAAGAGLRRPPRPGARDRLRQQSVNAPHYPTAVTGVAAIGPSDLAWKLAGERLAAAAVPITRSGLDGEELPLPDDSCDTALSTWTLCTIPDVVAALAEVRRVLKPGGTLHFVEHGLAPDEEVQRWQHQSRAGAEERVFGGCHLTRPITDLLTAAGFTIRELDVFYEDDPQDPGR